MNLGNNIKKKLEMGTGTFSLCRSSYVNNEGGAICMVARISNHASNCRAHGWMKSKCER